MNSAQTDLRYTAVIALMWSKILCKYASAVADSICPLYFKLPTVGISYIRD